MKTLLGITLFAMSAFAATSVLEFAPSSIDGQPAPLGAYKGKVLLIVNVASKCGFTPQYTALEGLYRKYKSQGLVVIGFPANNFMSQEPGSNEEIKDFCKRTYEVDFPMYSKISVKGDDKAPLYQYLTDKQINPNTGGEIKWNFTKFLVDRNGKVIARFEPGVKPDSQQVVDAIEAALKQ
jgi:glutathione peroxidase